MTIARAQLSKRGVYKTRNGEAGGNSARDYRYYNESPQSYKTDREDRIFDTKGFKDKIKEVTDEFNKKSNRKK